MKKKGFTLVEMLITVGLITLVIIVIVIALQSPSDKQKEKEWNRLVERITSSANAYYESNQGSSIYLSLMNGTGYEMLTIETLVNNGLLDENNLVDPRDNISIFEKEDEGYKTVKAFLNDNKAL